MVPVLTVVVEGTPVRCQFSPVVEQVFPVLEPVLPVVMPGLPVMGQAGGLPAAVRLASIGANLASRDAWHASRRSGLPALCRGLPAGGSGLPAMEQGLASKGSGLPAVGPGLASRGSGFSSSGARAG